MKFFLDKPVLLETFLQKTKARCNYKGDKYLIKQVFTDSRDKINNGLFFALKGKTFDGHKFVKDIITHVDFVIISEKIEVEKQYESKLIFVEDTTVALDSLASIYRNLFTGLKVIAVVGSNGKTTVKEILKSIISRRHKVCSTEKNYNNLFGLAYTLFQIKEDTEFCILELGISLKGEMKILGSSSMPDVVVFTNIGKEHLEFLNSLEDVFNEETEIIKYVREGGFLVINKDDKFLCKLLNGKLKKYYGIYNNSADVICKNINYNIEKTTAEVILKTSAGVKLSFNIETKLFGEYNIYNILSAICASFYFGIDDIELIQKTVFDFEAVDMRGKRYVVNQNILFDESYNANPDSMKITIKEFLSRIKDKQKILVLGDMLELGKDSVMEHANLFNEINIDEIKKIFLVGEQMRYLYERYSNTNKIIFYESLDKLEVDLEKTIYSEKNLAILFKSSNDIGLYKTIKNLVKS